MKSKVKKVAKYTVNILNIINALLIGLNPIWNIPHADKIIETILVVTGVISTYLLGNKAVSKKIANKSKEATGVTNEEEEENVTDTNRKG